MRKLFTLLFMSACLLSISTSGIAQQERYLDEVFTSVTKTDSVIYSFNYSVFPAFAIPTITDTIQVPQYMDIYEPTGDTATNRPVIIFAITGTFFPAYINGGFAGELNDSTNVAFATQMAKKGYVVAVVQYRRGWNPFGSALVQQRTILEAAYRGIQDVRAAVRFFRKTEAENGDPYGIDGSRIALGGTGTGGYMSYGAAFLDRYEQTLLTKFFDFNTSPPTPFLDTTLYGNPQGTDSAKFNAPQHAAYSSEFNMGFALGGALGDKSWVEAGDVPFVSIHSYEDPFAPYMVGDVIAGDPTTNPPSPFAVIPTAAGGYAIQDTMDQLGNNDIFKNIDWGDSISDRAAMINDGLTGLYPFITPYTPGDAMCLGVGVAGDTLQRWGTTWSWYDEPTAAFIWNQVYADQINAMPPTQVDGNTAVCLQNRGFPNDIPLAKTYLDTVIRFLTPRLAVALELDTSVGIDKFLDDKNVKVFPNPSNDRVFIEYKGADATPIDQITLMDISGRTIQSYSDIRDTRFEISKGNLTNGLYLLQIRVGEKMANRKIMFN